LFLEKFAERLTIMISTLLSDPTFINWFGILLLTTMMVSFSFVFHGVDYFSEKMRTIFLCIGIASMFSLLALLIFIVTK
jgi:hypothetical protein